MAYFSVPYRVMFHDTMAYGSHHHMTNFKFQNVARETLLFTSGPEDEWKEELAEVLLLTRDAYSFNLAPVMLGEQVGVLLTYEAPSRSSVRLCFRTIRADGTPVSCGFQTLIVMHRETHTLIPAPRLLTQYLDPTREFSLLESLTDPSLAERLRVQGGRAIASIFPDKVRALGQRVAASCPQEAHPRILDEALQEYFL